MKVNEMRQLSSEELGARVADWQEELFRAKCTKVIGQLTDTTRIRIMRHQIARAMTIINEMKRNAPDEA